jgi:hypothetical protein
MPSRTDRPGPGYRKRISSEEEREGYVLVLKVRLSFFPRLREAFALTKGDQRRNVRLQAYECACRGPARPHEHYFIRWPGLRIGDEVEITRMGERRYQLQVPTRRAAGARRPIRVQEGGL